MSGQENPIRNWGVSAAAYPGVEWFPPSFIVTDVKNSPNLGRPKNVMIMQLMEHGGGGGRS